MPDKTDENVETKEWLEFADRLDYSAKILIKYSTDMVELFSCLGTLASNRATTLARSVKERQNVMAVAKNLALRKFALSCHCT